MVTAFRQRSATENLQAARLIECRSSQPLAKSLIPQWKAQLRLDRKGANCDQSAPNNSGSTVPALPATTCVKALAFSGGSGPT